MMSMPLVRNLIITVGPADGTRHDVAFWKVITPFDKVLAHIIKAYFNYT